MAGVDDLVVYIQTAVFYRSLHIHHQIVHTSHFPIFSMPQPGGGVYLWGPNTMVFPKNDRTSIKQKIGKSGFQKPGTGPIGFILKILVVLCVRNSDLDPARTKTNFGTPIPKTNFKSMPELQWVYSFESTGG